MLIDPIPTGPLRREIAEMIRGWNGRPNPAVAVRESPDAAEFERTLQFVPYIMRESERY